jgi:uncharacterized protein
VKTGWRFLAFLLIAIGGVLVATVIASMLVSTAAAFGYQLIVHPLTVPAGLLFAHAVVVRRFEGGDWRYVLLHREAAAIRRVAYGKVYAIAAIGIPSALLLAAGYLSVAPAPPGNWFVAALNLAWLIVPLAFAEELLARGYIFSLLRETWGWRAALVTTSVGFGLLHMANPGSSPQAIFNVVLAGVFLGLVMLRYASLYAAWAAHAAWNLVLAAVLHAEVSGITMGPRAGYRVVDTGPDWLTGGVWGPEGGAAAALGLAVASFLLARPLLRGGRGAGEPIESVER